MEIELEGQNNRFFGELQDPEENLLDYDLSNFSFMSFQNGAMEEELEIEEAKIEEEKKIEEERVQRRGDEAEEEIDGEEDENNLQQNYAWEEKNSFYFGLWTPRWLMQFRERSGPRNLPLNTSLDPFQIFSLFFDDEMLDLIVRNSNIYAEYVIADLKARDSIPHYLQGWVEIQKEELVCFLCIYIYIGIVKLPNLQDYWKVDSVFPEHIVMKLLSYRRFIILSKFLHLSDIRNEDPNDKLSKVRPFLTPLLARWRKFYYPHKEITIDERMIKFTGRLSFKQYIKGKRHPYGIKAFLLADSTNGYVYNMDIYTGKNENGSRNATCTVVKKLLEGLAFKGHCLYLDNYFSTVPLLKELESLMIGCSGTLRKNRKYIPEEIKEPGDMNLNEIKVYKTGNLVSLVWMDNKPVRFLTNFEGGFSRIQKRTGNGLEIIIKPTVISNYNHFKSGVDRSDQYGAYYSNTHRSTKWWKKIFTNLIETTILNSYIIYKESLPREDKGFLSFRKELVGQIGRRFRNDIPEGFRSAINTEHTLMKSLDGKWRNCKVCSKTDHRKQTSYMCPIFNFHCHPECFIKLHTMPIVYRNKASLNIYKIQIRN